MDKTEEVFSELGRQAGENVIESKRIKHFQKEGVACNIQNKDLRIKR